MGKLTDELKLQHKDLTEKLYKIREIGISTPEGQKLLLSIKLTLLKHLEKEDQELYPALREKAKTDAGLSRTMELFAKDMDSISKTCMEFFAKYSDGGSGIQFGKEFGRLFVILSGRISKEEDILYKVFDKNS